MLDNVFWLDYILATFQGYINQILTEKLHFFDIIYLDNILIYTKNREESYVKAV